MVALRGPLEEGPYGIGFPVPMPTPAAPSRLRARARKPSAPAHPFLHRRSILALDGLWDFAFLGGIDPGAFDPAASWTGEKVPVPSAFDALPDHAGRRGAAVYRTTVEIPPGHPARLEFGAIGLWGRVYVDGLLLAEQRCGYTPFRIDVPASAQPLRRLVVLVDNRFDPDRCPMHEEKFDFYQYGGIFRQVRLHVLPAGTPSLDAVRVTPLGDPEEGRVRLDLPLSAPAPAGWEWAVRFDDGETWFFPATEPSLTLRVPCPRPWSPGSPHLHRVRVALCDPERRGVDDVETPFGLRRIEVRDGRLFLNGQPLVLRGYNRHEWHPHYGPAVPAAQMAADLQLLRDLGCNFVRGSHYPQDPRFLELCDAHGILVWEETLGWQQDHAVLADPAYRRDHRAALRAMIEGSYNNPSVIMRGFLNEAESHHPDSRPIFEESAALVRELDPSRLVSYATDRPPRGLADLHFALADVISVNLYPGWYGCEGHADPLSLIGPGIDAALDAVAAQGFARKPVLVSEIGAEGLYGWHDPHRDFFSEEYQARYLATACAEALSRDRCCGIALWQFSDTRTYGGGRALGRPRTYNNKGTLDEFRRPKLAYAAVREVFRAPPSVLKDRKSRNGHGGNGAFTLVEMLAVTAIIAVLAGVLLTALPSAMEATRRTQCASNLRQIGIGLFAYAGDHDNVLPPAAASYPSGGEETTWGYAIWTYAGYSQAAYQFQTNDLCLNSGRRNNLFRCPGTRLKPIPLPAVGSYNSNLYSYGLNVSPLSVRGASGNAKLTTPLPLAVVTRRAQTALVTETSYCRGDWWGYLVYFGLIPHAKGSNVLFFDGHVEWRLPAAFPAVETDPFWSGM